MAFAGIGEEDSYASTLADGLGVPVKWPKEWYVENLVRENERREKKAKKERGEVEFVKGREKEEGRSRGGTPKVGSGGGSELRKTKFDRR